MASEKKTIRTTSGLCDALFDEFDMLRNGQSDHLRASSISKLAIQIINTKRLEIEVAALKCREEIRSVVLAPSGLKLGEK